jgi:hypothetical protein
MQVQYLISVAQKSNFEQYLDCPHPDKVEYANINCLIMTCMNGKYDGEVVEANWNYNTGEVVSFSIYSQFNGSTAKFKI